MKHQLSRRPGPPKVVETRLIHAQVICVRGRVPLGHGGDIVYATHAAPRGPEEDIVLRSRSLPTAHDGARRGRGTGTGSARGAPRGPRYGMRAPRYGMRAASPAAVSGREGLPPDPAGLRTRRRRREGAKVSARA